MRSERETGDRQIPRVPPKGQRIRLLIDSDAKNEIDDQWAIALAILSPERFGIEGSLEPTSTTSEAARMVLKDRSMK